MYATAPTGAVLGWFEVGCVVRVSAPSHHRQITAEGYVAVRELRQYCAGGVAIEVIRLAALLARSGYLVANPARSHTASSLTSFGSSPTPRPEHERGRVNP